MPMAMTAVCNGSLASSPSATPILSSTPPFCAPSRSLSSHLARSPPSSCERGSSSSHNSYHNFCRGQNVKCDGKRTVRGEPAAPARIIVGFECIDDENDNDNGNDTDTDTDTAIRREEGTRLQQRSSSLSTSSSPVLASFVAIASAAFVASVARWCGLYVVSRFETNERRRRRERDDRATDRECARAVLDLSATPSTWRRLGEEGAEEDEKQATRVEDAAFGVLAPRVLARCRKRMGGSSSDARLLQRARELVVSDAGLARGDVVVARRKGWFSAWKKQERKRKKRRMRRKEEGRRGTTTTTTGDDGDDADAESDVVVRDLLALRVVLADDDERGCYAAMGRVKRALTGHGAFSGKMASSVCVLLSEKDFIGGVRKANGYRSLHATFLVASGGDADGPSTMGRGRQRTPPRWVPLEVQVRTRAMDRHATTGPSAHWFYKHQQQQ